MSHSFVIYYCTGGGDQNAHVAPHYQLASTENREEKRIKNSVWHDTDCKRTFLDVVQYMEMFAKYRVTFTLW